jgi:predicted nucleotidyltransferase
MRRKTRKKPASGLASALFTPVQQRVLGLLFGQPERTFGSAELIRLAESGTGAAHRQLQRLERAALVRATRLGNQKLYQANRDSPIFSELHGLVVKTAGLVEPLHKVLAPVSEGIEAAFVFGSIAKGTDGAKSDVDLLVVSDSLTYTELYELLQPAEKALGRTIQPTVMTRSDWNRKRSARDSFAKRVAEQPRLFVIGGVNDVA